MQEQKEKEQNGRPIMGGLVLFGCTKNEKSLMRVHQGFCMVTRTGIEPMLPP